MKQPDDDVVTMSMAHDNGDVEVVRQLIAARPELATMAPDSTWLHRAAEAGYICLVDFWLERGWDVNCNLYGKHKADGVATPLQFAKDVAMTRHLLSRGATVNVWTRWGGTPLHFAVVAAVEKSQRGRRRETPDSQADQIRALLAAGADPALADFEGRTPLALAMELRRKTAEKALREAGAPEKGHRPAAQAAKAPRIDLRKDAKRLATALKNAIKRFARQNPEVPLTGLYFAVSGIEGYGIIAFDVSGADNPWDASHSEYATVEFPKWSDAYHGAEDGVKITGVDGTVMDRSSLVGDEQFEKPFFDACVAVLEEAQQAKAFAALSRAATFTVGVEATLGYHGTSWQPVSSGDGGGAK